MFDGVPQQRFRTSRNFIKKKHKKQQQQTNKQTNKIFVSMTWFKSSCKKYLLSSKSWYRMKCLISNKYLTNYNCFLYYISTKRIICACTRYLLYRCRETDIYKRTKRTFKRPWLCYRSILICNYRNKHS